MSTAYVTILVCDEAAGADCRQEYRFTASRPDGGEQALRMASNRGWMRTARGGDPFDSYDCCPACRAQLNRGGPRVHPQPDRERA